MRKTILSALALMTMTVLSQASYAGCKLYGVVMSTSNSVSEEFVQNMQKLAASKGYEFSLQNSQFLKNPSALPSGPYIHAFNSQLTLKSKQTDDMVLFMKSEPDMHELIDEISAGKFYADAFTDDKVLNAQSASTTVEVNFCDRGYDCDDSNKKFSTQIDSSGQDLVKMKKQFIKTIKEKISRHEFKGEFDEIWEQVLAVVTPGTVDQKVFENAVIKSLSDMPVCR